MLNLLMRSLSVRCCSNLSGVCVCVAGGGGRIVSPLWEKVIFSLFIPFPLFLFLFRAFSWLFLVSRKTTFLLILLFYSTLFLACFSVRNNRDLKRILFYPGEVKTDIFSKAIYCCIEFGQKKKTFLVTGIVV